MVSCESICRFCLRYGTEFAARLRKLRPRPSDTWHIDEVYLRIEGGLFHLWCAVDQHGVEFDILTHERRNVVVAERVFRRSLVSLKYKPSKIVTDALRIYGVAQQEAVPDVRHWTSCYLNNWSEDSPRPTRR